MQSKKYNDEKIKKHLMAEIRPFIQFIFANGDLLSMLEKRATALKKEDFDKAKAI